MFKEGPHQAKRWYWTTDLGVTLCVWEGLHRVFWSIEDTADLFVYGKRLVVGDSPDRQTAREAVLTEYKNLLEAALSQVAALPPEPLTSVFDKETGDA